MYRHASRVCMILRRLVQAQKCSIRHRRSGVSERTQRSCKLFIPTLRLWRRISNFVPIRKANRPQQQRLLTQPEPLSINSICCTEATERC